MGWEINADITDPAFVIEPILKSADRIGRRRLGLIFTTGGVGIKDSFDLIPHAAEDRHDFFLGACSMGGIIEAPVVAVDLAGKHRAGLIGIATDGDHGLDVLIQELVHVLAGMGADVDADLGHGFDTERVDITGRLRTSAGYVVLISQCLSKDAFSEMGAAGVAGAKDEDSRFAHGLKKKDEQFSNSRWGRSRDYRLWQTCLS